MKLHDKIATALFWLVAGAVALCILVMLALGMLSELREQQATHYSNLLWMVPTFLFCLVALTLGVRQCYRSLRS